MGLESGTILFDKIIFGPVKSRRLGLSLGVNLLPTHNKICNFNCIYCECGYSNEKHLRKPEFHIRSEVRKKLEEALIELSAQKIIPDAITFAGNGEPTMHPEFHRIMDDTLFLRDRYLPEAEIAVLTNATMLNNESIVEALRKADHRILKLDAGTEELYQQINQPRARRHLSWIADHLHYFHGNLTIQTMFIRGDHHGTYIDNTTEENVSAWLELLKRIKPKQVMIYSLDRHPAEGNLEKVESSKLNEIAGRVRELGIRTTVS